MKLILSLLLLFALVACEAPLELDGVEASKDSAVRRTDIFMAAVDSDDVSVIVGAEGVIISADSGSSNWKRQQVKGKPMFIDITNCPQGLFAAVTMGGEVWTSSDNSETWTSNSLDTKEIPQAITCDERGKIWVVGSFSTIYSSTDGGETWDNHSLDEDIILSTIQFFDTQKGIITGEFGTVLITEDGGETWNFGEPVPHEFYPLASVFKDSKKGWVVGLNGIIYSTSDGAKSWQQEHTDMNAPLYGISIVNDQVVAVGDYGSIIYKNIENEKNGWNKLEIPVTSRFFFRVVHPLKNNNIIIAGGAGSLEVVDLDNVNFVNIEIE